MLAMMRCDVMFRLTKTLSSDQNQSDYYIDICMSGILNVCVREARRRATVNVYELNSTEMNFGAMTTYLKHELYVFIC